MGEVFFAGMFAFSIGTIFTLIGVYSLKRSICLSRRGIPTQATVVAHVEGETPVSIVEFTDLSGTMLRVTLQEGGCPAIGELMPILYDRDVPTRAIGGPLSDVWRMAIISTVLGLLRVAIGIGIWTRFVPLNQ
jgi:uncharacterized protein DUF3592